MSAPLEGTQTSSLAAPITSIETSTLEDPVVHNVPPMPSGEIASTQRNMIDPFAYEQWINAGGIVWDSSQPRGYTLYKRRVSPANWNSLLAFYTSIYNTWWGSLMLGIKMGGTGFMGGQLMVFKTPPNVDPDTIDVESCTFFGGISLDPKETGIIPISCYDQRNVDYHWIPNTEEFTSPFGKYADYSGWVAIKVIIPLTTTTNQDKTGWCPVAFFTKAGGDFGFGQLMPPNLTTKKPAYAFDVQLDDYHPIMGFKFDRLAVLNVSTVTDTGLILCPTTVKWSPLKYISTAVRVGGADGYYDVLDAAAGNIKMVSKHKIMGVTNSKVSGSTAANGRHVINGFVFASSKISTGKSGIYADPESTGKDLTEFSAIVGFKPKHVIASPAWDAGEKIDAPNGEGIVNFFFPDDTTIGCTNTRLTMYTIWNNKFHQVLLKNQTPVFALMSSLTNQPLTYLRLNPKGFFSAAKGTNIKTYALKSVYLRYESTIFISEHLPRSSDQAQSRSLHDALQLADDLRTSGLYSAMRDEIRGDLETEKSVWQRKKEELCSADDDLYD